MRRSHEVTEYLAPTRYVTWRYDTVKLLVISDLTDPFAANRLDGLQ